LHDKQTELTEAIAPSNGHDSLGQALEAVENKLDAIDTRLVEGDERFGRIEESLNERSPRIDHLEDRSAETLALVAENHAMFKNYIEAWTPLAARAVGEWGVDGMKTEQTMKDTKKTKKKPKA
jgi:predicted  nucleic acid-binding Zn-ribbon protein